MTKKKLPGPAEQTSPAAETLRKIGSWDPAQNPPVDELIGFLGFTQDRLLILLKAIDSNEELILKAKEMYDNKLISRSEYVNRKINQATFGLIIDFLNSIDHSADVLGPATTGVVTDAFTQGMRIGLLLEKMISALDGRYKEKWQHEFARRGGGEGSRLLKKDSEKLLFESVYAQYRGQPKACQKMANELHIRHKISGRKGKAMAAKTVERKLKELGLLDNA